MNIALCLLNPQRAFLCTLLAFMAIQHASAARHSFDVERDFGGQILQLRGTSTFVYMFFKVYDAAFYTPEGVDAADTIAPDTPRALKLVYHRNISREQMITPAAKLLEKNFDAKTLEQIQSGIDAINALYVDVGKGDSYTLTYTPGTGTTLLLNEEELGTVPGEEFARCYFSIWLGDKPISPKVRTALLGQ